MNLPHSLGLEVGEKIIHPSLGLVFQVMDFIAPVDEQVLVGLQGGPVKQQLLLMEKDTVLGVAEKKGILGQINRITLLQTGMVP